MSAQDFVQMKDGVRLSFTQTGEPQNPNLLFLNGWRQTAAQWRKQVEHFEKDFRVTTYDYRGHGESDKPLSGYNVLTFVSDLNELIRKLDLKDITVVGHSMGSTLVWGLWKYHPESRDRISRFVSVDGSPCMLIDPSWTPKETKDFGGIFTRDQLDGMAGAFDAVMPSVVRGMFTDKISEEDFAWVWAQNQKMPNGAAAELFLDTMSRDWRDVVSAVDVPTLIVGGEASILQEETPRWLHAQIPRSRLHLFGKEEGGHFVFWESPESFNKVLDDFLEKS
ncbi:Alpha/Beta hydrolase protein [Pestalotiopsis sp. NC0098]|nr:Alpha/Beta hydrolase protein [Pestalotiopsis sp. NC0098]